MPATPRVKFAPAGIVFNSDFNLPTADVSSLGIQLGAALKTRQVSHVFMPNKITVKKHASIVGGRDLGANDRWYNEGIGLGPTSTTINSNAAWDFTKSRAEGLRLARADSNTSWSVVGGVDVTSGNLAFGSADGPRSIFIKVWDSDGTKYLALQLKDSASVDYWTIVQEGEPHLDLTTPPSAGRYVYCASYKSSDRSIKLYINSATTALVSSTVASDKNNTNTGRWCIGGVPNSANTWEGPLGYAVIMTAELHGASDLDAIRLAAMTALANASFGYNVTLT